MALTSVLLALLLLALAAMVANGAATEGADAAIVDILKYAQTQPQASDAEMAARGCPVVVARTHGRPCALTFVVSRTQTPAGLELKVSATAPITVLGAFPLDARVAHAQIIAR